MVIANSPGSKPEVRFPPTLIASIYGMNFEHMPELHWHYGYVWALSIMGVTAAVMLVWFYRKGWLSPTEMPKRIRRDKSQE